MAGEREGFALSRLPARQRRKAKRNFLDHNNCYESLTFS
jgi:hypothetical protein